MSFWFYLSFSQILPREELWLFLQLFLLKVIFWESVVTSLVKSNTYHSTSTTLLSELMIHHRFNLSIQTLLTEPTKQQVPGKRLSSPLAGASGQTASTYLLKKNIFLPFSQSCCCLSSLTVWLNHAVLKPPTPAPRLPPIQPLPPHFPAVPIFCNRMKNAFNIPETG